MRRRIAVLFCLLMLARVAGPAVAAEEEESEAVEPAKVRVQHVLIGFKHSVSGKKIERSKSEAEALAGDVLETAEAGVEFAAIVKKYTDDRYPGVYTLVNKGETPGAGEYRRYDMMNCFGDVAFSLEVGEIGMAEYHPSRCKFGWHVIKRLD
jgi:hypothetical protein